VVPVSAETSLQSWARARVSSFAAGLMGRALLVAILVTLSHQFEWEWLRFLTSEAVLRISAFLGMETQRLSVETVRVQGEVFCFVISCTFIDVMMGIIPLVWNLKKSVLSNLLTLNVFGVSLFAFNILRLETAHLLHTCGVPWIVVDNLLGGLAYFAVWIFIGRWSGLFGWAGWRIQTRIIPCKSTNDEKGRLSHLAS
jgi:hypothetical protein